MKNIVSIVTELEKMVESHVGIAQFLIKRKRFEGWVQLEVVRMLLEQGVHEINVENTDHTGQGYYDISYLDQNEDRWAIELKVLTNNNITWDPYDSTPGPIDRVLSDANNLILDNTAIHKMLLILAYPVACDSPRWQVKLQMITALGYEEVCHSEFNRTQNSINVQGVVYAFLNTLHENTLREE